VTRQAVGRNAAQQGPDCIAECRRRPGLLCQAATGVRTSAQQADHAAAGSRMAATGQCRPGLPPPPGSIKLQRQRRS